MKTVRLMSALVLLSFACSRSKPKTETEPQSMKKPETGLIEMKPEAQQHVGLRVAPASRIQMTEYLQVTGTVQPIDSRVGDVRSLARGRGLDVLVKVGDRVKKGQPLIRFDNIEAIELVAQHKAAQAELQRLKVQHTAVSKQTKRYRSLAEIGAVPQKDVEMALAEEQGLQESIRAQESVLAGIVGRLRRFGVYETGSVHPTTTIDSPFSGVVVKAQTAPGEVIDTDRQLFSIADLSRVWVQAEVYEKDLGRVRLGQTAFISVDTYPEERFPGKVTYISDVLDPKTRTAKVRCEVANQDLRLKLDMFATVALPTKFSRKVIAVPTAAVLEIEGKDVVFIHKTASHFEAREVRTGKTVDGQTEILEGLSEGEPVVIQGAFHLKSIVLGKKLGEKE